MKNRDVAISGLFSPALPLLAALLTAGSLLLTAAAPAAAQTASDALRFTRRAPATGVRLLGMGGAGRAGIDDPTALYYNPAGLGWISSSQFGGDLAILSATDEANYRIDPSVAARQSADVTDYGGNAFLAYRVPTRRGALVFSAGYNQVNTFERQLSFRGRNSESSITGAFLPARNEFEVGADGQLSFPADVPSSLLPFAAFEGGAIEYFPFENEQGNYPFEPAVLPGTSSEQVGDVTETGRLQELSFGAGFEAAPGVMVGLSANFSFGNYRFDNVFSELDNGANDDYEVIRDGTTYLGLDEVRFAERFEDDLGGINLRGGFSAEAAPGLRLGLTVESPTFYSVDETFTEAAVTTFFDDGGALTYGGRPGDDGFGEFEYDVRTPWRLGAGLQANTLALTDGVADLTLAADLEFVDWSQLDLDSETDDFADVNRQIDENFGAVLNTNLGAELRVAGAALRAGFAYQPDPRDEELILADGSTSDRDRLFFSAGLGYRFAGQFQVDVGWMQERFDDQYQPYRGYTVPSSGTEVAAPLVEEDVTRNRFLVGLRYFF